MHTNSYRALKNILRGTDIPALELALTLYSVKYLNENSVQFANQFDLYELIQEPTSVKEKLKSILHSIENTASDLSSVYSLLNLPWNTIENKLLFEIILTIQKDQEIDYTLLVQDIQIDIKENQKNNLANHTIPPTIQDLLISLLQIKSNSSFYDGTAGIAGLLLEANHLNKDKNLQLFGQELSPKAWAVGKLLLLLNGIENTEFVLGNTLTTPAFIEDNQLKRFDYIAMAMPFGISLSHDEKENIENDPYERFVYGRVSQRTADMAFLQHALSSSTGKGRVVLVVTNGTLFRGGGEAAIRQKLIDTDQIESVISLSDNMLFNVAIPISILILNKAKPSNKKNKIRFIKADKLFETKRREKYLTREQIDQITELVDDPKDYESLSKTVDISTIAENLLVSKYIKNDVTVVEGEGMYKILFDNLNSESSHVFKFEEIGTLYKGLNNTPQNSQEETQGEYKIIKMSDVAKGHIQIEKLASISFKPNMKVAPYVVKENDILISSRGYTLKIAIVPPHDGTLVLSHNFIAIRPNLQLVDPEFLKLYLNSPVGRFTLNDLNNGTALPVLNAKDLAKADVYLPNLSVQQSVGEKYKNAQREYEERLTQAHLQLQLEKDLAYEESGLKSFFKLIE